MRFASSNEPRATGSANLAGGVRFVLCLFRLPVEQAQLQDQSPASIVRNNHPICLTTTALNGGQNPLFASSPRIQEGETVDEATGKSALIY